MPGVPGPRSRTVQVAQRRRSLVKLLVALLIARMVVTVADIAESHLSWFSALISAAIAVEAWRAWRVARAARQSGAAVEPIPDSGWDRFLRPIEHRGPAILYALAAIFAVAYVALAVAGTSRETLMDVTAVVREATTICFVVVIVAGYQSVKERPNPADVAA